MKIAFINEKGAAISFDCSTLIEELKADIVEFNGDMLVEVVTKEKEGITIYKDYNFVEDGKKSVFDLKESEKIQRMTASALLILYKQENEIL